MASPVMNRASQAASHISGQAANDAVAMEKMAANKAAASQTDIVKTAKGFSLSSVVGSAWNVATMALFAAPVLKGAIGLIGKIPKLGGIAGKTNAVIDLQGVKVGELKDKMFTKGAANESLFKEGGLVHTATGHGEKLLGYAKNTSAAKSKLGQTAIANIKESNVGNVVMNAGFAIQQTASVGFSLRDKVRVLQQIQEDLTGKKPSALTVLMGGSELDPMVRKARGEATSGKALASMGLQIAGAAGNIYLAVFDKSKGKMAFAKTMAIGVAPGMAAGMLTASDTTLQAYKNMTLSIAQTGQADIDLYRNVAIGFVPNAKTDLVDKIAKIGAEQHLAPKEYLQLMSSMSNPKAQAAATAGKSFVATEAKRRAANDSVVALRA